MTVIEARDRPALQHPGPVLRWRAVTILLIFFLFLQRSVTSPLDIPTSPISVSSPPLSPLSPQHRTVHSQGFPPPLPKPPSPSLPNGGSDQRDDDLDSFGSDEAFSPSSTPRNLSTPERFNGSPQRLRHDSTEPELEPELARLPPLPVGKASAYDPSSASPGVKSPLGNFRKQMNDVRDSPTGSEFSTSARIGTPTGRPPSAQGSEGGNLSIGEVCSCFFMQCLKVQVRSKNNLLSIEAEKSDKPIKKV